MKWYRINMINEEEKEDTQPKIKVNSSLNTAKISNSNQIKTNSCISSTRSDSPVTTTDSEKSYSILKKRKDFKVVDEENLNRKRQKIQDH